jgi:hypothetical protein
MFARCDTLVQALQELEAGRLPNADTIVVGRRWWERLSTSEQTAFRARAEWAGVTLNVDDQLSPTTWRSGAGHPISGCQASIRSNNGRRLPAMRR